MYSGFLRAADASQRFNILVTSRDRRRKVRWGLGINSTVRPALTDNPPAYIYVHWPDYGPLRESRKPGIRSRMEKEPMHSWMRDTATHFFNQVKFLVPAIECQMFPLIIKHGTMYRIMFVFIFRAVNPMECFG